MNCTLSPFIISAGEPVSIFLKVVFLILCNSLKLYLRPLSFGGQVAAAAGDWVGAAAGQVAVAAAGDWVGAAQVGVLSALIVVDAGHILAAFGQVMAVTDTAAEVQVVPGACCME